jgi:shikimate kinase
VTRHVVLLGLMGAGKTSIGRLVAARLDRELVDGDVVLDTITGGRTAADFAAAEGIDALHEKEARIALDGARGLDSVRDRTRRIGDRARRRP